MEGLAINISCRKKDTFNTIENGGKNEEKHLAAK